MQVSNNVVITIPTSGDGVETSRVLPTQGNTRYGVTVLVTTADTNVSSVTIELDWSNDMETWFPVSGSSQNTTNWPRMVVASNWVSTSLLPGAFVRLRYTVAGNPGGTALHP